MESDLISVALGAAVVYDSRVEPVGKIIARNRAERGWSQEELAKTTGLAVSSISKVERGVVTPHPANLCAIADALKISRDVLLVAAGLMRPENAETTAVYLRRDVEAPFRHLGRILKMNDSDTLRTLMEAAGQAIARYIPGDPNAGGAPRGGGAIIDLSGDATRLSAGGSESETGPEGDQTKRGEKS